ncbi:GtrA family protein [Gordonia sp. (in: high G+C Gram-positive bacteria)]|uniref:GtrA family protein n=1 Tax=Gordonia sp. (in: high G+C Gram-positive bacteria) TaxID=84139 RepID=UPI0039E407DD
MPDSVKPDEVFPEGGDHDPHIPAPVELPFDGPEEMADDVDLKTAIIRFIITGAGSAVLDFGLTMLLQKGLGWDPAYAKALGFVLGTTTAYLINRRWTFKAEPSRARFVAVMLLYLTTFAVQVGLYALLEHLWSSENWVTSAVSFVIAQGTATVINFVVQRAVIFKLK